MDPHFTAKDLARIYNVQPGTIRSWACRDGWRRTRTRPIRYNLGDAQASYDRRHRDSDARKD
jgi:uncharacterized protein YjcR